MSETQVKVTDTFRAADEEGNEYTVSEYTTFRHTTTTDIWIGGEGSEKEYRLGNGTVVRQIGETAFEMGDKVIRRL